MELRKISVSMISVILYITNWWMHAYGEQINKWHIYLRGNLVITLNGHHILNYFAFLGKGKEVVQLEFQKQIAVFQEFKIDFLIAEVKFNQNIKFFAFILFQLNWIILTQILN